jgi:hypothetical protein
VGLVLAANAIDPLYSSKVTWADGLYDAGLSDQQLTKAFEILNLQEEVATSSNVERDLQSEITIAGHTRLRRKVRATVGTLDPIQVGTYLTERDPSTGRAYMRAIEREERTKGIVFTGFSIAAPLLYLLGVVPVHLLLAPKNTPLKVTTNPYLLVTGASLVVFAAYKVFVSAPVFYFSLPTYSGTYLYLWLQVAALAVEVCMMGWILYKMAVYLRAVLHRSWTRTVVAIVAGYMASVVVAFIFMLALREGTERIFG